MRVIRKSAWDDMVEKNEKAIFVFPTVHPGRIMCGQWPDDGFVICDANMSDPVCEIFRKAALECPELQKIEDRIQSLHDESLRYENYYENAEENKKYMDQAYELYDMRDEDGPDHIISLPIQVCLGGGPFHWYTQMRHVHGMCAKEIEADEEGPFIDFAIVHQIKWSNFITTVSFRRLIQMVHDAVHRFEDNTTVPCIMRTPGERYFLIADKDTDTAT